MTNNPALSAYRILKNLFKLREIHVHDYNDEAMCIYVVGQDTDSARSVIIKAGFKKVTDRLYEKSEVKVSLSLDMNAECMIFTVSM